MFHNSFKLAKRYKKVRSLFSHFQTQFPKWSAKNWGFFPRTGAKTVPHSKLKQPASPRILPLRLASIINSPHSPLLSSPTPSRLASPRCARRAPPPQSRAPDARRPSRRQARLPPVVASAGERVGVASSLATFAFRTASEQAGFGRRRGVFFFGSYVVFKRASRFADRAVGCRRE